MYIITFQIDTTAKSLTKTQKSIKLVVKPNIQAENKIIFVYKHIQNILHTEKVLYTNYQIPTAWLLPRYVIYTLPSIPMRFD